MNSLLEFKETELESLGIYGAYGDSDGFLWGPIERLSTPITPKENFLRFVQRKEYCWVPNIRTDVNRIVRGTSPDLNGYSFKGGYDAFGCLWSPCLDGNLPAFVKPGNPVMKDIEEWEKFPWPDPDKWDWEAMRETYKMYLYPDRINQVELPGLYNERLIQLLGAEDAMCAYIENEDEVNGIFDKLTDFQCRSLELYKEYLNAELVWLGDDWGTEHAPFFSRNVLNRLFTPHYKKILKKCEELNIYPITHCCGNVTEFIPDFIEMGAKLWEAQERCNEGLEAKKNLYKDKLFFSVSEWFMPSSDTLSLEAFEKELEVKAKRYLMSGNVLVHYYAGANDGLWREKNRIAYTILRKTAAAIQENKK